MRTQRLAATVAMTLAAAGLSSCSGGSAPPAPAPAATRTGSPDAPVFPSPDDAATAFLQALGNQDAAGACRAMAAGGQAVASLPDAMQMCVAAMSHAAQQANAGVGEGLARATVSGARVDGDSADLSTATVTPPAAQQLVGTMKAARIQGSWYVTA